MQRTCNIMLTLGCPGCREELLVTLDQVYWEALVRCPRCGTTVPLREGAGVPPPAYAPVPLSERALPCAR
jgi:hypothetical protein